MNQIVKKLLATIAIMLTATLSATAGNYPEKPVRLIVNFGAGGTTDTVSRLLVSKASEILGNAIVIVNKGGAGGTIGVAHLSKQKADGYWIGTCNMPAVAIIPQLRSVPYKPAKDLVQVAAVMPYEYGIFARKDAPYNTWDELVAYAKANPGKVTYGSVGTGTTNHLTMERIAQKLGIKWRHAPFKGGAKAIAALVGGHVDIVNNTIGPVISVLRAKRVKPILVTSEKRFSVIPDVPTMAEKGLGFSQVSYMSIIAPAGIPDDIRIKIEKAFEAATQDKGVLKAAGKLDLHPAFLSGAEYTARLQKMQKEWGKVLDGLGIKAK